MSIMDVGISHVIIPCAFYFLENTHEHISPIYLD